jgi:hypothetical protein
VPRTHIPYRVCHGSVADAFLVGWRSWSACYEMELAEHRSTTERAHRAELTAKDATIAQQRYEITDLRRCLAESEADAYPPPCPAPGPDRAAAARYSLARRRGLQRGSSRATHRPPQWVAIPHRPQAQA